MKMANMKIAEGPEILPTQLNTLQCLSIGNIKLLIFLLFQMENSWVLGVLLFKHIRVVYFLRCPII